jgi:4-nitrophenyl phosphatase
MAVNEYNMVWRAVGCGHWHFSNFYFERRIMKRINEIECFLLDMDGTFYLGNRLLPGALELIALLEGRGTQFLFLTNNSSRTRKEYADKIRGMGLDLPESKIFTSGEATAIYLAKRKPGARLYVVGTPALEREFAGHGFVLTGEEPDFAVLGFDTTLTYEKIWKLCDLVTAGVPYIATHPDINCPTESGYMPDIGAMMAMVAASTGKQADVIIGKPNGPIIEAVMEKLNLPVDALGMVGDRLYTDIALGSTGLTTVLVLSGETSQEDLQHSPFQPDYVLPDLAGLVHLLQQQD